MGTMSQIGHLPYALSLASTKGFFAVVKPEVLAISSYYFVLLVENHAFQHT